MRTKVELELLKYHQRRTRTGDRSQRESCEKLRLATAKQRRSVAAVRSGEGVVLGIRV